MDQAAEDAPDFAGKVVAVSLPTGHHWALLGPTLETRGGRRFLVGRSLAFEPHWAEQATICIAWEGITTYMVWESVDVYKSQVARFPATPEARPRRGWLGRRR